ncbi:MAG: nicotinamide-nucleotide amidohydrolase family protein [Ruminococcaceae bacterium]|nr:nicotinamide-nucleotide amidohydrolase family protein [Oscillospiraceae bacterium]
MTHEEKTVALLKERGWRISFAESCTAGLAVGTLVDVPSASSVLDVSFITYANEAKTKYAHVKEETLALYGAVSEETALAMAEGVAKESGAEVGVGISGIAGPDGGTAEKPVGMVCFGFYINGKRSACTCRFGEELSRREVRECAVRFVFRSLAALLQK